MRTINFFAAVLLTIASVNSQSPSTLPADPGPLVPVPSTSLQAAVGYRVTSLFSTAPTITAPSDFAVRSNGALLFTPTSGVSCSTPAVNHIYQVAMSGGAPVPPATLAQFTATQIAGHILAVDSVSGTIFAAGTCDQTQLVYRIPASGVPQVLNPTTPLNDPDGLAIGTLPGVTGPVLFVACFDTLYYFANLTATTPTLGQIPVNLGNTGLAALGNWGSLVFDPVAQTLIAGSAGTPAVSRTIELSFTATPTLSATANLLSNSNIRPLGRDDRGVRLFGQSTQVGYMNSPGAGATFVPFLTGLAGRAYVAPVGTNGSFYLLDGGNGNVYRVDPALRLNRLSVSAATGGTTSLLLNGGVAQANQPYLVVVGVSGAAPGFTANNVLIPLNYDQLTLFAFNAAFQNFPELANWTGVLNASGQGQASLVLGPGIALPNFTLTFCLVTGIPNYASNATWLHVTP